MTFISILRIYPGFSPIYFEEKFKIVYWQKISIVTNFT